MIKMIATDIDGTIFEWGKGFSPAVMDWMARLKKAGVNADDQASIILDNSGFDMTIFNTGTYTLSLENGRESKTFTVEVKLNRFVTVIDIQ